MFLLDTNVVSELRKIRVGKADSHVVRWAEGQDTASLFLSAITIHELEIGVSLAERRDSQKGAALRTWLEAQVLPVFEGRILPVDIAVGRRAAQLHIPNPRPINDAFLAATAIVHGMVLVSRNTADFQGCGVSLFNPWL
ncbi:type II toxin-antitoxin system VapC family toxin [Silvibacterium sp.]|uniref:type II toxin-antitoxin system VapC family toxin n=1 Tax=Silvibacterium sp. TaxID=1964179 RepID=UPI0039E34E81